MNQNQHTLRAACLTFGLCVSTLMAPEASASGTAYAFTVSQPTSSLTYSFTSSAPFTGTMIGENSPLKPANEQTRTKRLPPFTFTCGSLTATQNDVVTISATIAASGSTGTTAIRPAGTFKLGIDTAASTSVLQDFNVNLVASGAIEATANLNNFTYQSFCAINPGCTAPFLVPISLPLGTVSVTSLVAAQAPGAPESGTLSANGPNAWNFSVPCTLTVTPAISFSGTTVPADPQTVASVFAGTITVSGATATMTGSAALNYAPPTNTTPAPQAPTPFTIPSTSTLCPGINLILTITITSSSVTSSNTANLAAAGTKIACRCDANNNGGLEVQDIFDFLNLWFAGSPLADFNGGGLGVQDIFDFLSCWFAKPLGC